MMRILLVDDEPDILSAFQELLVHRLQAEVEVAVSGAQALGILESKHFDLLVADHRMPGMSGIDLIALAKQKAPGTRCVLFTAYRDNALEKRAMQKGADLVMSKSVLPTDLAQRLRQVALS